MALKETTAKLTLDTRRSSQRKDMTYPLKIRIRHKGKNELVGLSSDLSILKEGWNPNKKEIRAVEGAGRLRERCKEKIKLAQAVIDNNKHLLEGLTTLQVADLVRNAFENPEKPVEPIATLQEAEAKLEEGLTLKKWNATLTASLEKKRRWGLAAKYNDDVSRFLTFYGNDNLLLKDINKSLIEDYMATYISKAEPGNEEKRTGGLNSCLRTIRAILNHAVDEDQLLPEFNPFTKINPGKRKAKIPKAKPGKRAVDVEIVLSFKKLFAGEKVGEAQIQEGTIDWFCVAECLFMWETLAMNFIDLAKLRVKDVFGSDFIRYTRSKTQADMKTGTTELSKKIAAYFAEGKSPEEFLFRYGWLDTKQGYQRYKTQRRRWNSRITKLASEMGYENVKFTTYSIRHTLATELNEMGMDRDSIGKLYAHKDGRSIDTYIDKPVMDPLINQAQTILRQIDSQAAA